MTLEALAKQMETKAQKQLIKIIKKQEEFLRTCPSGPFKDTVTAELRANKKKYELLTPYHVR
jgi:hypothetical protein